MSGKMKNKMTRTRIKRSSTFFFITVLVSFLFYSCGGKKSAVGLEDEIIVFADSTEFYDLESSLLTVFSKLIYTPQPEILFNLTRKNITEFEKYKNRKSIVFVAPLNSSSDVAKFIDNMLDQNVKNLVNEDSVTVVNKKSLWANDQLVMVLTAPDMQKLNKSILDRSDDLIHYFQRISDDRLKQSLYNSTYEQKKIEAQILKKYGWMIYVQTDYMLAKDDSTNNFVWLRRTPGSDLERWIFVHWIDNASPEMLNRDSVSVLRNKLTNKYLRSSDDSSYIEISNDYKTTREVNFLDRYALSTQGLWRMSDGSMGGPFINYVFYDEPTKRLYMLDASIYAPKFYKKKLIQQVDVLLQSFLTQREVHPDKYEDLMDELE